ncbi:MAG: hypothetical protein GEU86_15615 [Actinophytocola sp.]|nr:hypothetical protein [Actinophytocola sp.]
MPEVIIDRLATHLNADPDTDPALRICVHHVALKDAFSPLGGVKDAFGPLKSLLQNCPDRGQWSPEHG